jgi:cyclopropane fatty-acyl-phospholipid synthase-like methyltransferase
LLLAQVTKDDLVYDLGCGDGRILIAAARRVGARGVGVDIEPFWIQASRRNAQQANVDHLLTFVAQDALTVDLSPATVLVLYLVEWSTSKLLPMVQRSMKAGTRVVSHSFKMADWNPSKVETFIDATGSERSLYLWVVGESGP